MPVDQSMYQSEREQGVSSFTKKNAIVFSHIMVLLTLLQQKGATSFETHRPVMMLFIVTMLIYAFAAVGAISVEAPLVPVLQQICIAAGFLACDLLLLILAPPFGYFFLVLLLLYYVFTLALHKFLRNCTVYKTIEEKFQIWYGHLFRAESSIQQQDGFSQAREMNVEPAEP